MAKTTKATRDPGAIAANLPKPKPGMQFTIHGLDVLCLYVQLHGLQVVGFHGDKLIVDLPRGEKEEQHD